MDGWKLSRVVADQAAAALSQVYVTFEAGSYCVFPPTLSAHSLTMEDDMMLVMGLSGFGKIQKKRTLDPSRFDKNKRIEAEVESDPLPQEEQSLVTTKTTDDKASDVLDSEANPDEDLSLFPVSHELILKDHAKVISALTLDPSGARILSGSHDYDCKLWDFGGMNASAKPFKTWEPAGSYYIHDLKYSTTGDQFLCISGTSQAKLYDRDGEEVTEYIKGDPYIRDMKNTSGHVADLHGCAWHPRDHKTFITCSADSTIRVWDVEHKRKQKTVIVVKSKERGARTKVTACAYSTDGKVIAGGCLDGALHLWNTSSNFVRPNSTVECAHMKNTEIGSIVFSVDNKSLLTRASDDTVKLWDVRAFKKPLLTHSGVMTLYPQTNAIFSPDEKYILTGTGAPAKGQQGKLVFLRRDTFELARELEMENTVVKVLWHSKINQIVAGMANGQISVLYSPMTSINGAKLLASKGPSRKPGIEDMAAALLTPPIVAPHALSMYKDGEVDVATALAGTKRKREKDRTDPRKSRRPDLPVSGPGKGGRVGASATQHVVRNLVRDTTRDEDPREALLKYAEVAERDPQWTAAWRINQPKPVFQEVDKDEGDEEDEA